MTIGEKIKTIRVEKGLSQENVYPTNQSLVSQIEKGTNKNPSEQTLRIMAANLEMPFEELISDTGWASTQNTNQKIEYALSQTEMIVTIEDSEEIKTTMKSYPAFDKNGNPNKYDPDTGFELLTNCNSCNRIINTINQIHCLGCGEKLLASIPSKFMNEEKYYIIVYRGATDDTVEVDYEEFYNYPEEGWSETSQINGFTTDIKKNNEVETRIVSHLSKHIIIEQYIEGLTPGETPGAGLVLGNYNEQEVLLINSFKNKIDGIDRKHIFKMTDGKMIAGAKETNKEIGSLYLKKVAKKDIQKYAGIIEVSELYKLKDDRPNLHCGILKKWWVEHRFNYSYYTGMLNELKRYKNILESKSEDKVDKKSD